MELKRTITLKFDSEEWQTLADAVHLLENLGRELQRLGSNDDVILECVDGDIVCNFTAKRIFELSTSLDFIADGGRVIVF